MSSCRIWIPTKQKYERYSEINCEQYRDLLKSIDDDDDFHYNLNQILFDNTIDKSINLNQYTIIDRFIIFLQLKIHSYGSQLKLTRICDQCETQTKFTIDLNKIIDILASVVDKSFRQSILVNNTEIVCDIPMLDLSEASQARKIDMDERLEKYLFSFIHNILIKGYDTNLGSHDEETRTLVCRELPYSTILKIKESFIEPIHKSFKDLLLISSKCSNINCSDKLVLNFDINNIVDAIRILFKDDSAINMLSQYANISSRCHFDYNLYKNITPQELNIIYDMVSKSESANIESSKPDKEFDLSEEYHSQTEGMVETASEFL